MTTLPLETLRNARIGIDVNHYLSKIHSIKRESLADAIGGIPSTLFPHLESDLKVFKDSDITPVFVFSGVDITETYRVKATKESTSSDRFRGKSWAQYAAVSQQSPSSPVALPPSAGDLSFKDYNPLSGRAFFNDLTKFFTANSIEFVCAPYLSWIQLGYMYKEQRIDAVFGPNELLLLESTDKVIHTFDIRPDTHTTDFKFVDKHRLLIELNITPMQLLDIAVSIGCDLQLTTLPLYNGVPPASMFGFGMDLVQNGQSIYAQLAASGNHEVITKFQKGIVALRNTPVLKVNGKVEPLDASSLPSDLHEIIGQRLPHEYFFYVSIGLLAPKILEALIYDAYYEKTPLDGVSTNQHRELVRAMIKIKSTELGLLTQNMNRYYQFKKIAYVKYFEDDSEIDLRKSQGIFFSINNMAIFSEKAKFSTSSFLELITSSDKEALLVSPIAKSGKTLKTTSEIISTALLRTLHFLDIFSPKSSSKYTEALRLISTLDPSYTTQYLLFLVHLKLSPTPLHEFHANSTGGSRATDTNVRDVNTLISRLLTFIPTTITGPYSGAISRSLLNFRSGLEVVQTNVRELLAAAMVSSLANGEVERMERTREQWVDLVAQTPFGESLPSTVLGTVGLALLDNADGEKSLKDTRDIVVSHFTSPSTPSIATDLQKGLKFVKDCVQIADCLNKSEALSDKNFAIYSEANKAADKLLATFS